MMADDMAIFAKVIEANGFTAAARVLGFPKVRVSRSVAALEAALGARLLERTTRRIELTAAGRSILEHCRRVAFEVEAARVALLPVVAGSALRVAVDGAYGRLLVAPLLSRFLERFPQVAVELVGPDDEVPPDVEIRSARPDGDAAGGDVRLLGAPPMILCAATAYLAARPAPQRPADLGQHALLWGSAGAAVLRLTKDGGTVALPFTPRLSAEDPAALHSAVAAGLGLAALPEFLCRQGIAMRRLVRVLPDWEVGDRVEIVGVARGGRRADPAVRSFLDFVAANLVAALAPGGIGSVG
jgi:DNA-binding transcriptional LysR family regulator